jgi:hypothetical protein
MEYIHPRRGATSQFSHYRDIHPVNGTLGTCCWRNSKTQITKKVGTMHISIEALLKIMAGESGGKINASSIPIIKDAAKAAEVDWDKPDHAITQSQANSVAGKLAEMAKKAKQEQSELPSPSHLFRVPQDVAEAIAAWDMLAGHANIRPQAD